MTVIALSFAATWAPPAAAAQTRERSGEEVVQAVCAACHRTGAKGSPKIGDKQAWARLASRGLTSLTDSALKGVRNMPAHGGNPSLTDGEIERAITYMVNQSGGQWVEPAVEVTTAAERRGKEIVDSRCSKCHATGVNGAPKIGDRAAWIQRLSRGLDVVVRSAIHGHGPMPPRGGVADLTDSEIRAAVIHMFNPTAGAATKAPAAAPASDPYRKVIAGTEIHLGILSAQALRARHPKGDAAKDDPESRMHGGIPADEGYYHINISLTDVKTRAAITDAQVEARVADPVMGGETKKLEPIKFNKATSYGNYFRMPNRQTYAITVRIRRPGASQAIETQFDYKRF
jgi:cytochrome c5